MSLLIGFFSDGIGPEYTVDKYINDGSIVSVLL